MNSVEINGQSPLSFILPQYWRLNFSYLQEEESLYFSLSLSLYFSVREHRYFLSNPFPKIESFIIQSLNSTFDPIDYYECFIDISRDLFGEIVIES